MFQLIPFPLITYQTLLLEIPAPSKAEMNSLCAGLGKSKIKAIALSLIPEYAKIYVFKSRSVPTIMDFFDNKCLELTVNDKHCGIVRHESSRSGQDTSGESLISKAIIHIEKLERMLTGKHQSGRKSSLVACPLSTSSQFQSKLLSF